MMNVDSPDVSDGYAREDRGISPKLDAALDLLSNHRRRYVLYTLRQRGDAVTLEELAEQVVAWEDDDADERRVRAALYHNQIPRLESAGVVAFDDETKVVRLTSDDESPIAEYLDLAAREESVA